MLSAVTSVGDAKVSDAAASRAVARPAPAPVQAAPETVLQKPGDVPQPISPRIVQDSLAGAVVTEFVGSNGEVSQQVPSQAALAYLRAGLTAQGAPVDKPDEEKPATV
ncbi:MAG: hypothetical protein AB7G06_03870 [Bdellovibrionales bacterium]